MSTKMIAPALAALMLAVATSAYAARTSGGKLGNGLANRNYDEYTQCEKLASKFDKLEMKHQNAKNFDRAKGLRTEGMDACQSDNYLYGIHSLQQALLDIGVTPPSVHYF